MPSPSMITNESVVIQSEAINDSATTEVVDAVNPIGETVGTGTQSISDANEIVPNNLGKGGSSKISMLTSETELLSTSSTPKSPPKKLSENNSNTPLTPASASSKSTSGKKRIVGRVRQSPRLKTPPKKGKLPAKSKSSKSTPTKILLAKSKAVKKSSKSNKGNDTTANSSYFNAQDRVFSERIEERRARISKVVTEEMKRREENGETNEAEKKKDDDEETNDGADGARLFERVESIEYEKSLVKASTRVGSRITSEIWKRPLFKIVALSDKGKSLVKKKGK